MSDELPRRPIAEVLGGAGGPPAGSPLDGPLEAFLLIKTLDEDGRTSWAYRTTHQLNREELLGALVVHAALLRRELLEEWSDE